MTLHVCVYHRVTGNSIYNFEEKANRKMDEETHNLETTNYCPSPPERRRGREGGEKRSGKGGRQEEETRDGGAQSREENLKDGGCTSIYCTHIV